MNTGPSDEISYSLVYKELCEATSSNRIEDVNRLLAIDNIESKMAEIDNLENLQEALFDAFDEDYHDVIIRLLQVNRLVVKLGDLNEPLGWACEDGDLGVVKKLLEIPACRENAADASNDALDKAICGNHAAIVSELLRVLTVRQNFQDIRYLIKNDEYKLTKETLRALYDSYNSTEIEFNFTSESNNAMLVEFKALLSAAIDELELLTVIDHPAAYLPSRSDSNSNPSQVAVGDAETQPTADEENSEPKRQRCL